MPCELFPDKVPIAILCCCWFKLPALLPIAILSKAWFVIPALLPRETLLFDASKWNTRILFPLLSVVNISISPGQKLPSIISYPFTPLLETIDAAFFNVPPFFP